MPEIGALNTVSRSEFRKALRVVRAADLPKVGG